MPIGTGGLSKQLDKFRYQGSKTTDTSLIETNQAPLKTSFGISNNDNVAKIGETKSLVTLMKEALTKEQM
jgi:hypothetical protein